QERGVLFRIGVGDQLIDSDLATSPDEVHPAQAPRPERENSNLGARSLQRSDRTHDLDLLEPVRDEHGHGDPAQWLFVHEMFWHRKDRATNSMRGGAGVGVTDTDRWAQSPTSPIAHCR